MRIFRGGTYKPQEVTKESSGKKIKVEVHDYILLDVLIMEAELVISHCGAGILLECLRSPTATCIAVVNDTLMHNH